MKLIKTSSGKTLLKLSFNDWLKIGKDNGWTKEAQPMPGALSTGVTNPALGATQTGQGNLPLPAVKTTPLSQVKSKTRSVLNSLLKDPELQEVFSNPQQAQGLLTLLEAFYQKFGGDTMKAATLFKKALDRMKSVLTIQE